VCKEKRSIPSDLEKVFIIGLDYEVKKNGKIKHLRIFFTTLRLSEFAKKSKLVSEKKRNPRQIKSNVNESLNNADNLENFEETCINTAIDTISTTIASTSKNSNSDCMTAYRAPSSAQGKAH
jgi:hypothetical protein